MKVKKIVAESSGINPFVVPVLCFNRAKVSCYGQADGVEVTTTGSVNRVIADSRRPERYSAQEVRTISSLPEKRLGVSPAAWPGLPPEAPTRGRKLLDRALSLSTSTFLLILFGLMFLISLVLPLQASKVFLGIAYLYHLLSEVY